eukprot:TRINITY_DN15491_c0_g1_i1.p1 TRINITY_DN15491_c0_g1~~TRINITY_DN15491_c0_g1_i1.p1  ORF type:complete len:1110 (+),score=245.44 TRINITY_DN15491_c0_g1_i1:120-3449(+)
MKLLQPHGMPTGASAPSRCASAPSLHASLASADGSPKAAWSRGHIELPVDLGRRQTSSVWASQDAGHKGQSQRMLAPLAPLAKGASRHRRPPPGPGYGPPDVKFCMPQPHLPAIPQAAGIERPPSVESGSSRGHGRRQRSLSRCTLSMEWLPEGVDALPPTKSSSSTAKASSVVIPSCHAPKRDPILAEKYGRIMLGEDCWYLAIFDFCDGGDLMSRGYLLPAEYAMLVTYLSEELVEMKMPPNLYAFVHDMRKVDTNCDGRIDASEWSKVGLQLEQLFGVERCRRAAQRLLGRSDAEKEVASTRTCHAIVNGEEFSSTIYVGNGYSVNASVELLRICAKWTSPRLFENVRWALEMKADPNTALEHKAFNGYTPLIFLCMAQPAPAMNHAHMTEAVELLIAAKADIHRQSGLMPFGKWVPLRFAAQLHNQPCLEVLLKYINVGDRFTWAACENIRFFMQAELSKLLSAEVQAQVEALDTSCNHATVLMQHYAASIVGGDLGPDGARKLVDGTYKVWCLPAGAKADPDGAGLEGNTALMSVIVKGDVATTRALLQSRASPMQRNSAGATPLHLASMLLEPDIVKLLLDFKGEPSARDHAGLSPWMLAGELRLNCIGNIEKEKMRDILKMCQPDFTIEKVVETLEKDDWAEKFLDEEDAGKPLEEVLDKRLRISESAFFDAAIVRRGAYEGRHPRNDMLLRLGKIIIRLLQTDPLEGNNKKLCKHLLLATKGPKIIGCDHLKVLWSEVDNRRIHRQQLEEAVTSLLGRYERLCLALREEIRKGAETGGRESCRRLQGLPEDAVVVPEALQRKDARWKAMQDNRVLRWDPPWALRVQDGASCCLALLRLGVLYEINDYARFIQVNASTLEELMARGYVQYSEMCNRVFQDKLKGIAAAIAARAQVKVEPPKDTVPAKKLKRLMEKTLAAHAERGHLRWPGLSEDYHTYSHCFYILDTVRLSFTCCGKTVADQVDCLMHLYDGLMQCTAEKDGVFVVRQKSGFAEGVVAAGGYADIKLLVYADLGYALSFDGERLPLQIIGEVQLILEDYMKVKHRMHLAYEVNRGSFDRKATADTTSGPSAHSARRKPNKLPNSPSGGEQPGLVHVKSVDMD